VGARSPSSFALEANLGKIKVDSEETLDQQCIDTIRFLAVDAAVLAAAVDGQCTRGFETLPVAAGTCQMRQGK
jgi:hypothetical protein